MATSVRKRGARRAAASSNSQLQPTRPATFLPSKLNYNRVAGRAAELQGRWTSKAMYTSITIIVGSAVTPELVHRFRNFGEDIWRELRDTCDVDLDEIDAATNTFTIRRIRRRDLRSVTEQIGEQLSKHHFEDSAKLSVVQTE